MQNTMADANELTAVFVRTYPSKKDKNALTYAYEIKGTPEQLDAYKAHKGDMYREDKDTGKPMFFSAKDGGNKAKVVVSEKGEYFLDTSEHDREIAYINSVGGVVGEMLAKAFIARNPR